MRKNSLLALLIILFAGMVPNYIQAQEKDKLLVVETDYGNMTVYLYNMTPQHKSNIIKLAEKGFYNGTTFHRVISDFMIQGGDINSKDDTTTNDGNGGILIENGEIVRAPQGKEMTVPAEIKEGQWLVHTRGVLAGARLADRVNPKRASSSCQFYIVQGKKVTDAELDQAEQMIQQNQMQMYGQLEYLQSPDVQWVHTINWEELKKNHPDSITKLTKRLEADMRKSFSDNHKLFKYTPQQRKIYKEFGGTPHLDAQYTVFGQVVEGIDVIDKISKVEKGQNDRPLKDVKMNVRVVEMDKKQIKEVYKIELL